MSFEWKTIKDFALNSNLETSMEGVSKLVGCLFTVLRPVKGRPGLRILANLL